MASPQVARQQPDVRKKKPPQSVKTAKQLKPEEALIEKIKNRIWRLWSHNARQRYLLGKFLLELRNARAKYGYGTYMDDLVELDITYATARRLIIYHQQMRVRFARAVDYKPIRCLQTANNKWGEIEDIEQLERAMEQGIADKAVDDLRKTIEAEQRKVEQYKRKKSKQTPDYRVAILISPKERSLFKKAWMSMDEKKRSRIVIKAVMDAYYKSKHQA